MGVPKEYSIENDIDSQVCNLEQLHIQIQDSNSVVNFDGLRRDEDCIKVLNESIIDLTALDLVLKNHVPL